MRCHVDLIETYEMVLVSKLLDKLEVTKNINPSATIVDQFSYPYSKLQNALR